MISRLRCFSLTAWLILAVAIPTQAQRATAMADLFKMMPDTVLPILSQNNRLDMIDFMEAGMKAEVTNLLEGQSVMTALSADSLSIRLDSALRVDMRLEHLADSTLQVVVSRTYRTSLGQEEQVTDVYNAEWHLLSELRRERSSLLRRDESLFKD